MKPRKVVLDTNIYIGWLNDRRDADVVLGPGLLRYLSAVVHMEIRLGAITPGARRTLDTLVRTYDTHGRHIAPSVALYEAAGRTLQRLKSHGVEIRRASLVADVLIAHTARELGAAVVTRDLDFRAIARAFPFDLDLIGA